MAQHEKVHEKTQEAYKKSLIKNKGKTPGIIKEDSKRTKKYKSKISNMEKDTKTLKQKRQELLQSEKELLEGLQRAKVSQKEAYHQFEELCVNPKLIKTPII